MKLVGVLRYSMRVPAGVCPGGDLVARVAPREVGRVGAGHRTEGRSWASSRGGRTRSGREAMRVVGVGGGWMVGVGAGRVIGRGHHLISLGLSVVGRGALLGVVR